MAIRKLCVAAGCDDLALPGKSYCEDHQTELEGRQRERRAAAKRSDIAREGHALYNTAWWKKARLAFLRRHPLCVECQEVGIVTAARHVDHIEPHRGDLQKFRDRSNWQPLCHPCHSRKTAREVWHDDRGVSENLG